MTRRSEGHQASIGLDAAQGPLVATYQTRISDYEEISLRGIQISRVRIQLII